MVKYGSSALMAELTSGLIFTKCAQKASGAAGCPRTRRVHGLVGPVRRRAGSIPASCRNCYTVELAIRWPSLTSSPYTRRCPQVSRGRRLDGGFLVDPPGRPQLGFEAPQFAAPWSAAVALHRCIMMK